MGSREEVSNVFVVSSVAEHQQARGTDAGSRSCKNGTQEIGICAAVGLAAFCDKQIAETSKPSAPVNPATTSLSGAVSEAERPNAMQDTDLSLSRLTTSGACLSNCDSSSVVAAAAHAEKAAGAETSHSAVHKSSGGASAGMSISHAPGNKKLSLLTESGLSDPVRSVSMSTVSSSPSGSPTAIFSAETRSPAVANRATAAAPGPAVGAVAASSEATNTARAYFRRGRVLVVRAPACGALECTYTAGEKGEGGSPGTVEEECSLAATALQKFRSCLQQSKGAAEGRCTPASLLLQQILTTAAGLRPRSSPVHPPTSLSPFSAAAPSSFPLPRQSLSSQENVPAGPTTSAQKEPALQCSMPFASKAPSSSPPCRSRHELRPSCYTSSTLNSASASQALACSSVFPQAAEVEALARHPVMKSLGLYLRRGGVVALPTETVYGLGAAAILPDACKKIYQLKRRPPTDPLICHVASVNQAFDDVFDLDSEEDSPCFPPSSAAASVARRYSTHEATEVRRAGAATTSSRSALPPLSVAANTAAAAANTAAAAANTVAAAANIVSAACPARAAAEADAAGVASVGEAAAAAEEEEKEEGGGGIAAAARQPAPVLSAGKAGTLAAAVSRPDSAAAAGAGNAQVRSRERQHRKDMRLLVKALADAFWPGPLSIVAPGKILEDQTTVAHNEEKEQDRMKKKRERGEEEGKVKGGKGIEEKQEKMEEEKTHPPKGVALSVTSGTRLVAVRCPCNKYALALTLAAGVPIAAPSANLFGRISPTRAQHVLNQFATPETDASLKCSNRGEGDLQQENSDRGGEPSSSILESKQNSSSRGSGPSARSVATGEDRGDAAAKVSTALLAEAATAGGSRVELHNVLQQAEQDPQQQGQQQEQQQKSPFEEGVPQHWENREGLPLFSGEDFALLETEDDDGGCCVGIESTVVKVAAAAGPADSSAAAAADTEVEGGSSSYYEVQVLRRGVVTLDMLQEALDAAAAHHNARQQEPQQHQQQQTREPQLDVGGGLGHEQRQTRPGEDDAACKTVFTSFPRFVLTVSPKLQFHMQARHSLRDSLTVSAAARTSQSTESCSEQTAQQAVSRTDRCVLASTPSVAAEGTRNTLSATAKQEPVGGAAAKPALVLKVRRSATSGACPLLSAAAEGTSVRAARAGGEGEVTPPASGAGANQKTARAAHASTQLAVDVAAAAAAEKLAVPGDRAAGDYAVLPARELAEAEEPALREQPLEAPGMALTHYAPCVPCFLVSTSPSDLIKRGSGSNNRSDSSNRSSSEAVVDEFERNSKKVCTRSEDAASTAAEAVSAVLSGATSAVCTLGRTTIIECKDSILIDAGKDFAAFAPHFLQYFSLVKVLGESCDTTENEDISATAGTAGAAAAVVRDSAAAGGHAAAVCTQAGLAEAEANLPRSERPNEADAARKDSSGRIAERKEEATVGKRGRRESQQPTEEATLPCAWTQAAACSIFETLHAAEAVALKKGARAIFIHAEPLVRGAEHGLAVFDRLYRAASGKLARLQLLETNHGGGLPTFSFLV